MDHNNVDDADHSLIDIRSTIISLIILQCWYTLAGHIIIIDVQLPSNNWVIGTHSSPLSSLFYTLSHRCRPCSHLSYQRSDRVRTMACGGPQTEYQWTPICMLLTKAVQLDNSQWFLCGIEPCEHPRITQQCPARALHVKQWCCFDQFANQLQKVCGRTRSGKHSSTDLNSIR